MPFGDSIARFVFRYRVYGQLLVATLSSIPMTSATPPRDRHVLALRPSESCEVAIGGGASARWRPV